MTARGFVYTITAIPVDSASSYIPGNGQALSGHPTWIFTSVFASRLPFLLLLAGGFAAWLHHHHGTRRLEFRVAAVAVLALCSAATVVVGAGALLDRHIAAATHAIGSYPDSMRATAGEEILLGLATLVLADVIARGMRRVPEAATEADLVAP